MATAKNKYRRQFDQSYTGAQGEKNDQPSLTVPDMSIGVKDLLRNHTRGMSSDVHEFDAMYFDNAEIPIMDDLTSMEKYKAELAERTEQAEIQYKRLKDAKKELVDARTAQKEKQQENAQKEYEKRRQTSILDKDQQKTDDK